MTFLEEVNIYKLTKHDPNKRLETEPCNIHCDVHFCTSKKVVVIFSLGRTCILSEPAGQNTRGGVLLADIAFNRPTAQNLDQQGLAVMPSLVGMRKEHF